MLPLDPEPAADDFSDVNPEEVKAVLTGETPGASNIADMIREATDQAGSYNDAVNNTDDFGFTGGELGDMLEQEQ